MARVPTEAEIDAMSDAELEAYLDAARRPGHAGDAERPPAQDGSLPGWRRSTGAPRWYAVLLVIGSIIGIAASWELMVSEITILKEPLANLSCDINPFVSCGASLDVWQGNLLGVPNSFIGAMAFAVLLLIGLLLLAGERLPRWVWWGLCAGCAAGIAFVAWFLGVSVLSFQKLCPYCMVIWAVTIPVAAATWGQAAIGGHLGLSERNASRLHAARWWIAGAMYLAILAIVLVAFWDGWVALLR